MATPSGDALGALAFSNVVQVATGMTGPGSASFLVIDTAEVTPGNTVVLVVIARNVTHNEGVGLTITDSAGQTYSSGPVCSPYNDNYSSLGIYYVTGSASITSLTVQFQNGVTGTILGVVFELEGMAEGLDISTANAATSNSNSPTVGPVPTADNIELVIGAITTLAQAETITGVTAGWGAPQEILTSPDPSNYLTLHVFLQSVPSSGSSVSLAGTLSSSNWWGALMAGFVVTPALVSQRSQVNTTPATSETLTNVNAAVGQMALLFVEVQSGATSYSMSVTDSAGNEWQELGTSVDTGVNSRIFAFCAPVLYALSNGTVTVNNGGTSSQTVLNLSVWSGVAQAAAVIGTATGSATTSPTSAKLTAPDANDVVVGAIHYNSTTAPALGGSGWSALTGGAMTASYGALAYQIVAASGSAGPQWTTSSASYAALTIALRPGCLNLLTNGSFETNPTGLATGWTDEHTTPTEPTYSQSTTGVVDGTYSQEIVYNGEPGDTGAQKIEVYQSTTTTSPYPIVGGQTYTFSVWVSGSCTNAAPFIGLEAFDSSNNYLGEVDTYFTPSGTPTKVSATYTIPSDAVRIAVYMQVPELYSTSQVTLYLDDARLVMP